MPYSQGHNPNIPTDTPDKSIFGGWSCEDWVTYYYTLKSAYGYNTAKSTWLYEWENQSFWSSDYSWCKYSSSFSQFLEDENIFGQTNIFSETVVTIDETVSNIGDTLKLTTKYVLPVVVVGFALILLMQASKK